MRPPSQRRFLLGLSLTAALLAVAFAIMLAVLMRQNRTAEEATRLQGDSITSLTFQLEREFLRLRSDLALTLRGRGHSQPAWEAVTLRYEIFLSRVELLRDNPSTFKLRARSEYQELMPHLEQLIADATPLLRRRRHMLRRSKRCSSVSTSWDLTCRYCRSPRRWWLPA